MFEWLLRTYRRQLLNTSGGSRSQLASLLNLLGLGRQAANLEHLCEHRLAEQTIGGIDTPAVVHEDILLIRGWLHNFDGQIASIDIWLPEFEPCKAVLGANRADLLAVLPAEGRVVRSGFSASIQLGDKNPSPVVTLYFSAILECGKVVTGQFAPVDQMKSSQHAFSRWQVNA